MLSVFVTAGAAIVVAAVNWQAALSLEREKLRSALVQKPPAAGEPAQAAATLQHWRVLGALKDP